MSSIVYVFYLSWAKITNSFSCPCFPSCWPILYILTLIIDLNILNTFRYDCLMILICLLEILDLFENSVSHNWPLRLLCYLLSHLSRPRCKFPTLVLRVYSSMAAAFHSNLRVCYSVAAVFHYIDHSPEWIGHFLASDRQISESQELRVSRTREL